MPGVPDVGQYFDRVEREWRERGCDAEPLDNGGQLFEYETDDHGRETGRGHLLARITFPGFDDAYLAAEDWLVPRPGGQITRDFYAYDLIVWGAALDNWHRHYGHGDHRHRGGERVAIPRTTLRQAIEKSWDVLYARQVPEG